MGTESEPRVGSTGTITALPEGHGRNRFLLELVDAIRSMSDGEIQAEAARRLGVHLCADRTVFAQVDEGGDAFVVLDYCHAVAKPMAGWHRLDDFGNVFSDAVRAGRILAISDVESLDALSPAERKYCRKFNIRASLTIPVATDGRVHAFLALHQSAPRIWSEEEVVLAAEVADRIRAALESNATKHALREREEMYRALFENIGEGFCIVEVTQDSAGRVVDMHSREVNPAFEQLTGLRDVVGKSLHALLPNVGSYWLHAATRVIQTGKPERSERFLPDLKRSYSVQYLRLGGEGSRLLGIVLGDISGRKDIEQTSHRLAAIVETSDDAIIRKDLNGIMETWNAGAERIFGYAPHEAIGRSVTLLMPPDRVDEEPAILARLRKGERVDHYETVRKRKDGSLIDVSLTISPIQDSNGNVVAASKIARDISERKREESRLRESENRHGFLLMFSDALREQPDEQAIASVCVRMFAKYLAVDRCYIALLSLPDSVARMISEYHDDSLPGTYGAAGELMLSAFETCVKRLETGPLAINDINVEPGMSDAEKSALRALQGHVALIAAPLRVGEQDTIWTLLVGSSSPHVWSPDEIRLVEDVAERAWSALDRAAKDAALREREAELQRISRAKDEFIAMLGHELRNPLAPITTTLELMKLRAPDALVRERGLIEAQVHQLTNLVNDLLDVTRIATGKVNLDPKRVEIEAVIAVAVETTQDAMESRRQTLHVQVEEGLVVSGDRRRLVQVLVNLLGNAAKYSPPERNIWLTGRSEDGQVVLRVRDEGQGISPDLLPRIFESFTQDSQGIARSQGGLGLGLSIVRSLVLLHGGSVSAESDGPYRGSEFTVRLPLLDRPQPAVEGAEKRVAVHHSVTHPGRTRVLIVDDYAPAGESLALLLQEMGYHTLVAEDGAAGLAALATFRPQIALVDIGLPVIDGYEVAQTVRRTPGFEKLPLVAITGYGQASDHARAVAAGFNEHLVKPLDAAKISEVIERLCSVQ